MPAIKKASAKRKAATSKTNPFTAAAAASSAKRAKKVEIKTTEVDDDVKLDTEVFEIDSENTESKVSKKKTSKNTSEEAELVEGEEAKTTANVKYNKADFKAASNGKDYNFKIASWNINGIRAWLEKGGIEYIKAEDPDIFCCQETKCDKSKIPIKAELPNYHSYWLSGDTQGYSGVGLITKIKPIKVTYGINNKKFDNEGRVICAEYEKFYLINTYIPNSSRGLVRLPYRLEWEVEFRKYLSELEKVKPIILCGDLNVAHQRIDIRNPDTNLRSAGFTVEERECFTKLLADGYFDSFRFLYPDRVAYTFWSYLRNSRASNIGWRLDYFVMSKKLESNLVDNIVRDKVTGSDHCPIVLCLNI